MVSLVVAVVTLSANSSGGSGWSGLRHKQRAGRAMNWRRPRVAGHAGGSGGRLDRRLASRPGRCPSIGAASHVLDARLAGNAGQRERCNFFCHLYTVLLNHGCRGKGGQQQQGGGTTVGQQLPMSPVPGALVSDSNFQGCLGNGQHPNADGFREFCFIIWL